MKEERKAQIVGGGLCLSGAFIAAALSYVEAPDTVTTTENIKHALLHTVSTLTGAAIGGTAAAGAFIGLEKSNFFLPMLLRGRFKDQFNQKTAQQSLGAIVGLFGFLAGGFMAYKLTDEALWPEQAFYHEVQPIVSPEGPSQLIQE